MSLFSTLPSPPVVAHPPTSWVDPRTDCRWSPIEGRGMFAVAPLAAGTVVAIWGGVILSEADLRAGRARAQSVINIDDDMYLGSLVTMPPQPDEFMNHSCQPNVWLRDAITLVTMRAIAAGEELTLDYALFEADPQWQMMCRCGMPTCRGTITGNDWQRIELHQRYRGHFSPYIQKRINSL
jgi:uncharacterized protein